MSDPLVRHHPSEGEGCRAAFWQAMLRGSSGNSTSEVAVPDTVIFEHGYPRWWYQYDAKAREVRRSAGGKDLHAASILRYFVNKAPRLPNGKPVGVVATYTYLVEDPLSEKTTVAVEYHSAASLERFLLTSADARKKQGLLQEIVIPLELNYTVISIMWSPVVTVVRRRASKRMISDLRSSIVDRFVTFDGPEHHSTEVNTAADTKAKVVDSCAKIAAHFHRTQHLKVSSMQCFFVMNRAGEPVLLWCGALYFVNPHASAAQPSVPPTLMREPTFVSPTAAADEAALQTDLAESDAKQRDLAVCMTGNSPRTREGATGADDDDLRVAAAGSPAQAAARQRQRRADAARDLAVQAHEQWYLVSPDVEREYEALLDSARTAKVLACDVLYRAHSHFLVSDASSGDAGDVSVDVPFELARCLGAQTHVDALLTHLGLRDGESTSGVRISAPSQRLRSAVTLHPVPKLIADAEDWLDKFFEAKVRHLRHRCTHAIEQRLAKNVVALLQQAAPAS